MTKAQGTALMPQSPEVSPCAVGDLLASSICVHLTGFASERKGSDIYLLSMALGNFW